MTKPIVPTIGEAVDTASEAWRFLCEARAVSRMPREQRTEYLRTVAKRRGEEHARKLHAEAVAVFKIENEL